VEKLLEIKNLSANYFAQDIKIPALRSVNIDLKKGETIAIAGESGCGKSTLALAVLKLIEFPEGEVTGDSVEFKIEKNSIDLLRLKEEEMRKIRGKDISLVVQDPYSSLNPVIRINKQLAEIYRIHHQTCEDIDIDGISKKYLKMVHLPEPQKILFSYPHQLSGGMLQRVNIAAALINNPDILISDEPTSSLDVTVQKKIMDMFFELKDNFNLSQIFISHDLNLISAFADRVYIMYAGRVVEEGKTADIFTSPAHPYTIALLEALPHLNAPGLDLKSIPGEVPAPESIGIGCAFAARCSHSRDICFNSLPELKKINDNHFTRCIKR
jgi:oligopeptide/dipeptide ABC transporter ATP-binding protein